jgi:FkbM family methyltransferase
LSREDHQGDWIRKVLGPQRIFFADVGASKGIPSHLLSLAKVADTLLFEPDPVEAQYLENQYKDTGKFRHVRVYPFALAGSNGTRTFHVTNTPTGSSLLKPLYQHAVDIGDESYFYPTREIAIQTRTLSSVLKEIAIKRLDFIKLDVQGAELEILEGLGADFLSEVTGVEVEIGMPGGYEGQPGFPEMDKFLRAHGFELFDIKPARGHRAKSGDLTYYPINVFGVHPQSPALNKKLWEIDAVYLRSPQKLQVSEDLNAIRRLIVILGTYGLFSEAYHLLEAITNSQKFSQNDIQALKQDLKAWHKATHYCVIYSPWLFPRVEYIKRLFRRLTCGRRIDRWINQ